MEIHKNIEIIDLALKYKDILIIGDIQLGYEESMNRKGILIPRFQLEEMKNKLDQLFLKGGKIKKVVVNGDLKHEFGTISDQEWRDVLGFIDYILKKAKVTVVKGNHDLMIEPILKKRNVELVDNLVADDILITHGDVVPVNLQKTIIIGHEHAAVSFSEKSYEKFKCFLKGKWKGHTLIAMPSFNDLTIGTDLRTSEPLSPFLKGNLKNFEVFIPDEKKALYFGKLRDL